MTEQLPEKSGAALVIALGFLAVLTIIIVAFTAQMRTERLADRGFLGAARNQQLLNTALARAMEDITARIPANEYPPFAAFSSQGALPMRRSVNFTNEEDFIPGSGSPLFAGYQAEMQTAGWEMISGADNTVLGRVGYVVLNTSGLLDANQVGGYTNDAGTVEYAMRERGRSPAELQLSDELLAELTDPDSGGGFMGIRLDSSGELEVEELKAKDPHLTPALAMAYNRENAWRHFETLRDFHRLNQLGQGANILSGPPRNFRTFSFFPPEKETRTVMGETFAEVTGQHAAAVKSALIQIGITGENADFVFQQLEDYLDEDDLPTDLFFSVEPVPLINELLLTCDFRFTPVIEEVEVVPEDGGEPFTSNYVASVLVTNEYKLEVEGWFPFINAENSGSFSIVMENVSSDLPEELFGDIQADWLSAETTIGGPWAYKDLEEAILVEGLSPGADYDEEELTNAFDFATTLSIDDIELKCLSGRRIVVDDAADIELPVGEAATFLGTNIQAMAEFLFHSDEALELENYTNFIYTIGAATIDPRLNWNGLNTNHWVETGDNGYGDSIGSVNQGIIAELTRAPQGEPHDRIYVRNEDRIDSAYEFTYFLFDINRPWHTFQFFAENDIAGESTDFQTRRIAELLVPALPKPQPHGLINPNSANTNILATAFYGMPVDELVQTDFSNHRKLGTNEAVRIAEELAGNGPYLNRTNLVEGLSYTNLAAMIGGNTWETESVLRNALELFSTRDSTFTLLLAAQEGSDANGDNVISDDEVQSTQKAVVQVWRDPVSGKCACVFYGLADTLQSSLSGSVLSEMLNAFQPGQ